METEIKINKKKFDAVEFAREQKTRIAGELKGKSNQEIIEYFARLRKSGRVKPSA